MQRDTAGMSGSEGSKDQQAAKLDLLHAAVAASVRYIEADRNGMVSPTPEALAQLGAFSQVSVDSPISPEAALEMLETIGSPATMRQNSGRYFGFVNGGVTPVALAASVLSGTWDQNAALPAMSPAAAAIDGAAAEMIVDVLGLPAESTASFCGGATLANITGIVTGRDHLYAQAGWDIHTKGLAGAPPLQVIVSEEAHVSVTKTLRIAGFGSDTITYVPADSSGRMDADAMPDVDGPALLILQAGNVNTGHSDPFRTIIERLDRSNTWVHVDGAFGLWANAVPERRHHVEGVELADSWATDGHKWLNAPYDCGVVVCRHPEALKHSMLMSAAYVEANDERTAMSLGLQMSQAARAVPVWAILASEGRAGIAASIESSCVAAERFGEQLTAAGVELLAPVVINQVLVAFGSDEATDAIVRAVQESAVCWVGGTTFQGRRAMRISVSDMSTTHDDVDAAVASILEAMAQVSC